MSEYHKIQTVFKRNPETKYKTLLDGEFSTPELQYLAQNEWGFTEKIDGTNIRIYLHKGDDADLGDISFNEKWALEYKGRTNNAEIPPHLNEALDKIFLGKWDQLKEQFPDGQAVLYGEGYGAKIQKHGEKYREDQGFVLFDVKVGDWWLERENVLDVADNLGLEVAPIIGRGNLFNMVDFAKAGIQSQWGDFLAEGIVARPAKELFTRSGQRIITKIKTKDFER